jgi:hypothetical protein
MLDGQVARISFLEIQHDAKLENGLSVAGRECVGYLDNGSGSKQFHHRGHRGHRGLKRNYEF